MLTDIFLKNNEQDDRKKITVFVDPDTHLAAAIKLASAADDAAAESAASNVDLNVRLPDEPSTKKKGDFKRAAKKISRLF